MNTLYWTLCFTELPRLLRRCPACGAARFETDGRFRVNANQKRLDVWLVCRCESCKSTWNLTVAERTPCSAVDPATYRAYLENDRALALRLLFDPAFLARNRAVADWQTLPFTLLGTPAVAGEPARVIVSCDPACLIAVGRIVASGLGVSRSHMKRLLQRGLLLMQGDPSKTKTNAGFSFTLAQGWTAQ